MNEYSQTYCAFQKDPAGASTIEHPDGSDSGWQLHSWRPAPNSAEHLIVVWSRSIDGRPTMPHDMATQAALEKFPTR